MTIQGEAGLDTRRPERRLRVVRNVEQVAQAVAREVRAEMARQQVTESALAAAMGRQQQWLSRRKTGAVPFSAAELLVVAEYLDVPVSLFFEAGTRPVGPGGGGAATESS